MSEGVEDISAGGDSRNNWVKDSETVGELMIETISFSDGITVQHIKDGETIIRKSDGSILTLLPDNGIRIVNEEGVVRDMSASELAGTKVDITKSIVDAKNDLENT